jgi:hypothetical protein
VRKARLDDESERGVSVYADRDEFSADQCVAGITKPMDEKSASRASELELAKISVKKIR